MKCCMIFLVKIAHVPNYNKIYITIVQHFYKVNIFTHTSTKRLFLHGFEVNSAKLGVAKLNTMGFCACWSWTPGVRGL